MIPLQAAAYLTAAFLLIVGIAGLVFLNNLIKKIIAFTFISDAVNLILVATAYVEGGHVPILVPGMSIHEFAEKAALVFPAGIVLTNIVIGVSTTAVLLGLTLALYRKYGSLKASVVLRGEKE